MLLAVAILLSFSLESPWNAVIICAAVVIEIAEVYFWLWFLKRYRVQTGSEGMLGKRAMVTESDGEAGMVQVHGEIWRARFGSARAVGDEAKILGVEGLTLITD